MQLQVWDPVAGDLIRVALPPGFDDDMMPFTGQVLRAPVDVNGCELSSHFQVILVHPATDEPLAFAYVYSSDTGIWGNPISAPCPLSLAFKSTMVGGSLCWLLRGMDSSIRILEFDLDRQRLTVIEMPSEISCWHGRFRVMRAAGGGLGVLHLSSSMIMNLWKRKSDGDAGWVLENSIELHKLLSLTAKKKCSMFAIVEGNKSLFLQTRGKPVMIQLDSMKLNKDFGTLETDCGAYYHPFSDVYAAGI